MPEQFGEKQHEATPRRRQQAREQGQTPRSQDLTSAIMLLAAIGILRLMGGALVQAIEVFAVRHWGDEPWLTMDQQTQVAQWNGLLLHFAAVVVPIWGLIFLVAVMSSLGQVGFLFLPNKLALDPSRLSPLKGLSRIFSMPNIVRLAFGIFKITIVAAVAVAAIWNERSKLMELSSLPVSEISVYVVELLLDTSMYVGIALFVLALLDYAYQRWKHEQDLRMTTQEMRDEMKETQGDPQVAARRKAVQRQLTLQRIASAVPQADVVVTNPTELAIALKYDHREMEAPLVVAKGAGTIAQRIRRLALENGIPVVERKELARALYKEVEIGKPIPRDQYAAMAEVLRYVYELKGVSIEN